MLSARELNSGVAAEPQLDQRAPHVHARLRPDARTGQSGDARRAAAALHQEPAAGVRRSTCEVDGAEHLLRRAVERPRLRADEARRSSTIRSGEDNVFAVYEGRGGVSIGRLLAQAAVQHPVPIAEDAALGRSHLREPHPLPPPHHRARRADRAVPHLRSRSVPVDRSRAGCSGSRTPTRRADRYPYADARRRRQLHPQQRQGGDRRVSRHDDLLPDRPDRIRWRATIGKAFPGLLRPASRDARGAAHAPALSADDLRAAGGDVLDVPHEQPGGLLQQGRPVGGAGDRRRADAAAADGAVLHDHAAAGRGATPSTSRCCRSRRGRRTISRPGWWRAATARTTAGWSSSSFPKQKVDLRAAAGGRRASARTRRSRRRSRCGTSRGRRSFRARCWSFPIEESLIYIRPLYLRAKGGRIPELKRVIVAYQNQIVMEETLDAGDRAHLRPPRRAPAAPPRPRRRGRRRPSAGSRAPGRRRGRHAVDARRRSARPLRPRASPAQREGNWALYGEEINKLGEVLKQLDRAK